MESRRYSSETLYPFVPAAEIYRNYLAGILDCLIVVRGAASAAVPVSTPPYLKLVSITGGATNVYLFNAVCHDGLRTISFSVPKNVGIVRVASGFSTLIINTSTMFDGIGVFNMAAEVEPARVCWQEDEVTAVRLVNEERKFDPGTRGSLANNILASFASDGDVIKLVDGYNCELSYEESSQTLFIQAAPGLGKGLPATIPWDDSAPDITTGIRTINGINANGNVNIIPGSSVVRPTS